MIEKKKTLAALQTVVVALAPLDPEARRQVMEATHALLEIGSGCDQGHDQGRYLGRDQRRPDRKKSRR